MPTARSDVHVELRVSTHEEVPGAGGRRVWAAVESVHPVRILVRDEFELTGVLAVRGPQVAAMLERSAADTFRVTAHCLDWGLTVGQWTWERSTESGRWMPSGQPWVVSDQAARMVTGIDDSEPAKPGEVV